MSSNPRADPEPGDRAVLERLRESTLRFAHCAGSAAALEATLDAACADLTTIFGAARCEIWVNDRRDRSLLVRGSAGAASQRPGRVAADDPLAPAAIGLRLEGPMVVDGDPGLLIAPLRGLRRGLGALVLERPTRSDVSADPIALAAEIARLLSSGIETVQLIDEVMRQHRLLDDTFNSLADFVAVTDNDLRVVQINDALAARLGRPRAELLDRPLGDVLGVDIASWTARDEGAESKPARTRTFEGTPVGEAAVVTVTLLRNADSAPVGRVVVTRDITAQARLELEREALRHQLGHSEKLAALGQFVAGIAHEMNNPLQGVLGHLELLIKEERTRGLQGELRRISREAERAAKIVRDLLAFTGARRVSRRRLAPERVITRAITSRRASLHRYGITVVREPARTPAISGDARLLHQALVNVLVNAEHAIADSGAPGSIIVSVEARDAGSRVAICIRDTGPGIPGDVLSKMFDPFFTTKEVGRGAGLGLAITYGIINDHGGVIHAANHPDGGAVITIELPADQGNDPSHEVRKRY